MAVRIGRYIISIGGNGTAEVNPIVERLIEGNSKLLSEMIIQNSESAANRRIAFFSERVFKNPLSKFGDQATAIEGWKLFQSIL